MLMVFFSSGTNSQLVIRTVFVSWVALRARAGVRMSVYADVIGLTVLAGT